MSFPTELRTVSGADPTAVEALKSFDEVPDDRFRIVERTDGSPISLEPLFHVLKIGAGRKLSPTGSDAWFSPRLHWSLRLTRREASDSGLWTWLAHRLSAQYVRWRWGGTNGQVAPNRYEGAINKQAFARLWWGAELFRNGDDYQPVELLFANQDFPNSYIHRVFARNRPVAVATVVELTDRARSAGGTPTSDFINDVARGVNLWLAPLSIEPVIGHWRDDLKTYQAWQKEEPGPVPPSELPIGPADGPVPDDILSTSRRLVGEICDNLGP